ncbi:type I restriction-modification system subunit M N-terminal domain-containing protein [Pseudofrankia sp. DC12]|nr:type I restriction-modification system subunit M N-terminal domain-containing protein [Pseudofrankia sp. DC12]
MTSPGPHHCELAADIWAVADLLRGDYKRHGCGGVIQKLLLEVTA